METSKGALLISDRPLRLGVLTSGRQDWGILRSTCLLLQGDPRFDLRILAGGMHWSEAFGRTGDAILQEPLAIAETLQWLDDAAATPPLQQAALALEQVGAALQRQAVDALLLVGDRYETASAALAATLLGVPIAHLHGGEETEGAFDNALRHAITKLSHLHLVSRPEYGRRVVSFGEDPSTVHVVGAPGLDGLQRADLPGRRQLEEHLGLELAPPVVLVTLHPTTLASSPAAEAQAMCAAMDRVDATYVITLPNADPGHDALRATLRQAAKAPRRVAVEALGERRYWGMMKIADAMLGNSSSAILEAPALGLPAVDLGPRQKGRLREGNILHCEADADAIVAALRSALDAERRTGLLAAGPPAYADGRAAERVRAALLNWSIETPPLKRAYPSSPNRRVAVIGGGEHARQVIEALRSRPGEWQVLGFFDPEACEDTSRVFALPRLGDDGDARALAEHDPSLQFALGLGSVGVSPQRVTAVARIATDSKRWATVVHADAHVSSGAQLGDGSVVLAAAIVGQGARVGRFCILNSASAVEHDCSLGDFVHVSTGALLGGGVQVGEHSCIGIGSRVRDHLRIGERVVVGMGAVVVGDVASGSTMLGVPARPKN